MNCISDLNKMIIEKMKTSEYCNKKPVFGDGNIGSDIFLIGEAPGGDEEKQGRPFVGKAGKNLDEFIDVVGLKRENLYITNVVKIRPTNISPKTGKEVNRTPNKEEIQFFLPFLIEEINIISPRLIVTLGNTPLKAITGDKKITIGDCHAKLIKTDHFDIFPLYHPASIIYNRSLKDVYYSDLKKIREFLFWYGLCIILTKI